jgi:hypothetical protein
MLETSITIVGGSNIGKTELTRKFAGQGYRVVCCDSEHVILVGHGRFEAAKQLGLEKIPCLILNDLTEDDKIAYRILDNKLQNDSTWNIGFLESELKSINTDSQSLKPFNFDDLKELFARENEFTPENNSTPPPIKDPRHKIIVHFKNEEDLIDFIALPQFRNLPLTCDTKELEFKP